MFMLSLHKLCFFYLQEKCRQYWPEEKLQEQAYGQINMKVTSVETWADFTLRTFRLTMVCTETSFTGIVNVNDTSEV